jgi:hypothetical protein
MAIIDDDIEEKAPSWKLTVPLCLLIVGLLVAFWVLDLNHYFLQIANHYFLLAAETESLIIAFVSLWMGGVASVIKWILTILGPLGIVLLVLVTRWPWSKPKGSQGSKTPPESTR